VKNIEFGIIFVTVDSIILQKMVSEGEISWVMNSHLGQDISVLEIICFNETNTTNENILTSLSMQEPTQMYDVQAFIHEY